MKKIDAVFDEAVDGFTPIAEGTYPAHCNEFQVNEWGESKIFNLTFTIADEAKTLKIPKMTLSQIVFQLSQSQCTFFKSES